MPPLCRETSVSRTANVGTVGKNWLRKRNGGHEWVKHMNVTDRTLGIPMNITRGSIGCSMTMSPPPKFHDYVSPNVVMELGEDTWSMVMEQPILPLVIFMGIPIIFLLTSMEKWATMMLQVNVDKPE